MANYILNRMMVWGRYSCAHSAGNALFKVNVYQQIKVVHCMSRQVENSGRSSAKKFINNWFNAHHHIPQKQRLTAMIGL